MSLSVRSPDSAEGATRLLGTNHDRHPVVVNQ
jgi:hypothetical protein